jgi:diguanylate cyclase (GGDEF)-like protein
MSVSVFLRILFLSVLTAAALATAAPAHDVSAQRVPLQGQYWIDTSGTATIDDVARGAAQLQPMERRAFTLGESAMWMRFDLPVLNAAERWFLVLAGSAFIDTAQAFLPSPTGWRMQQAGDHLPVAQWTHPDFTPIFEVPTGGGTMWLRIANRPAPTSAFVELATADHLQSRRLWTTLMIGCYFGFGLLVMVLGLIHARLYGDVAFDAYCSYVGCMLLFQVAYTGAGGLFLWPGSAAFNNAAPAVFMLLMVASGIWFIREATSVRRHSRSIDRWVVRFCMFSAAFTIPYVVLNNTITYALLNLVALVSVIISISLCWWTWRKGETYSGWLFLGFLPIHLSYPFPALRAAGVLADNWGSQYAVLLGTVIEIPLLLYILHWRAKDFSENRARMRALDSTDPLTGLAAAPVLRLRLRDALRRGARLGHRCSVLIVDLANHAEILAKEGREAGDRALVVAASRLTSVVRDVDTVCRVSDTRFALLMEGPQREETRRLVAQHVVARGLERVQQLPPDLPLRFRVVTAWVPDGAVERMPDGVADEVLLMQRLAWAMDRLLETRKVVHHLEPLEPVTAPAPPMAA